MEGEDFQENDHIYLYINFFHFQYNFFQLFHSNLQSTVLFFYCHKNFISKIIIKLSKLIIKNQLIQVYQNQIRKYF